MFNRALIPQGYYFQQVGHSFEIRMDFNTDMMWDYKEDLVKQLSNLNLDFKTDVEMLEFNGFFEELNGSKADLKSIFSLSRILETKIGMTIKFPINGEGFKIVSISKE